MASGIHSARPRAVTAWLKGEGGIEIGEAPLGFLPSMHMSYNLMSELLSIREACELEERPVGGCGVMQGR